MRRKAVFISLIVAALAAVIVVPRVYTRATRDAGGPAANRPGGRPPGEAEAPLKVFVHRVEPRVLAENIQANGTLLADESVELRSEIQGKVVAIHFEEGARVAAGDLLLKTNDSELAAQLRQTRFRIELAKAQAARQKTLLQRGGTSQEVFDTASNEVDVLQSEAELIEARLLKTEIRAPFAGVIGLRHVSEGSFLNTDTSIATLQAVDRLKIDFSVSERYMGRLHLGSRVTFSVAGSAGSYDGTVYAIEPEIDRTTRTILVRARSENPGGRLIPGAFANVTVTLDEIDGALLVPTTAIIPGLNQRTLFVIEDGRAVLKTVETGIRLDREIQILSGLAPQDVVITSGLLQLRPGMPVEPIQETRS